MPPKPALPPAHAQRGLVAPLRVPWARRLQTAAVAIWLSIIFVSLAATALTAVGTIWLVHALWTGGGSGGEGASLFHRVAACGIAALAAAYIASVARGRQAWRRDGRPSRTLLESRFFAAFSRHYCAYFPATCVFDAPDGHTEAAAQRWFEPSRNYLCCCHPHGVFGLGVWTTFASNASLFAAGIRSSVASKVARAKAKAPVYSVRLHTLSMNFYIPYWREALMALGFLDVSRSTLLHRLARKRTAEGSSGGGNDECHISVIVPGGAAESIDCTTETLTLLNRKGFVRIAVETGCAIVPVYTFGETSLYRPLVGAGKVRRALHRVQRTLGFGTPLVVGRGVFNYLFGILPHRSRLVTVIGQPIVPGPCPPGRTATEHVDAIHAEYVRAVATLYRTYQPLYAPGSPQPELEIR